MIPTIGVLVAVYAVARLIQTPLEMYQRGSSRWVVATVVSALAILAITSLTFDLISSAANVTMPGMTVR